MASLIPKVNAATGSATAPGAGALVIGELAENKYTGRLYVKTESAAVVDPARVTLTGDVTGSTATAASEAQAGTISATVAKIQGRTVASTTPTSGQALVWNSTTSQWEPSTVSGPEGAPGFSSFAKARVRKYNATATYTAPTGLSGFLVMAFGAGGTITPVYNSATGTSAHGAQGGAAYAEKYYASPTGGTAYPIIIGASGGNTTFNSTVVLTSSSNITTISGGTGGTAAGGDFNANGGAGGASVNHSFSIPCAGFSQDGNNGGSGASGSRYGNGGNGATATGFSGSDNGGNAYNGGGLGGVAGVGMWNGVNNTVSSTTLASGISSLISVIDDIALNYSVNNASAKIGAYVNKTFGDLAYQWPYLPTFNGVYAYGGNTLSAVSAGVVSPTFAGRIYIIEFYA